MKMFKSKKVLALALALVAALGVSVTAFAATGSLTWSKNGSNYVVDYVSSEKTVDGIVIQTIERKWIPENRFDSNNPWYPKAANGTAPAPNPGQNTDKVQTLRNAGINSRNDLQTYAWSYRWSTTPVETYATESRLETNITFQVDESASADRWQCTFTQVVTYDGGGHPIVKYYIGSQEYSVSAIKSMFAQYGKAR